MPGMYKGKKVLVSDVDVAVLSGPGSSNDLSDMEDNCCPTCGACATMGTANTMQILGEVLNLVMPGTSIIPAADHAKTRAARDAGRHIIKMVETGLKPEQLITKEALLNAIMVDSAIGGSTNAVLHILSLARDLGINLTLDDFDEIGSQIKCICGVRPSGPYNVVDLHNIGGVRAIMKMLESKLYTFVPTIKGETWKEELANVKVEPNSKSIQ